MKDTAFANFKNVDERSSYSNRYFYISILASEEFNSNIPSLMGRIRNNYIQGLNKCITIPKIVCIVMEDALIKDVKTMNFGLTTDYEIRIKWLVSQLRKITDAFIDYLPLKMKRDNWPKFLFVCPSLHVNYENKPLRKKFTRVLEDIAAYSERTAALRLRNGWDFDNHNIFLKEQQRFTMEGLATFWVAIDKIIEEFDQSIFDSVDAAIVPGRNRDFNRNNDFSWQSPSYQKSRQGNTRGRSNWRRY